jgi:hypothetical protein
VLICLVNTDEAPFSETGEWAPVEGQTYYSKDAAFHGEAFLQEAVSRGSA